MYQNNASPNQPPQQPQQRWIQPSIPQQASSSKDDKSYSQQPSSTLQPTISPTSFIGNSLRASTLLMAQNDSHPLFPVFDANLYPGQEETSLAHQPRSMVPQRTTTLLNHDHHQDLGYLSQQQHLSSASNALMDHPPSSKATQYVSPPSSVSGVDSDGLTNLRPTTSLPIPDQYLASNLIVREQNSQATQTTTPQYAPHSKADTSCLLCKIRHRKCDYLFPCCSNCVKENRSFCLYAKRQCQISHSSSTMTSSPFLLSETEAESISSLLPKDNIESICKTIYNNISSIKSSQEITNKLSYDVFLKIILKVLPTTDKEQILQFMRVSLLPQTEKFVGSLEYFYKYFHVLGENDCSFIWTCQAMCFQRINEFALAKTQYEKARSRMAIVFDNVSDFNTMLTYSWLAIYLIGAGERQKAEYILNNVKFYVKEFHPEAERAHCLLRTVLLSESFLRSNYLDELLESYETVLTFFTPKETINYSLSKDAVENVSKYVISSNEKMFQVQKPTKTNRETSSLKQQLSKLKEVFEYNKDKQDYQDLPLGFHQLIDSLSSSSSSDGGDELNSERQVPECTTENVEHTIKQISVAVENIKTIFGPSDFVGNTFMTMLYSIVILKKHKSFKGEISLEAIKYADLISKSTQFEDFKYSSYGVAVPISLACRVHVQCLKNILSSVSLIITEYADRLLTFIDMDYRSLDMLARRFPLVDQKYRTLLKDAALTVERFQMMRLNEPSRFVTLEYISQNLAL
ncbi:hypothetical protein C9374_008837 [Naegleria lovaniensis]|uniref:Zn(2)-C6 fungal-type domain-containing protein n=1 Tax=Naegleria lovaniensis TaxID=51637 RepID=A0AA88GE33_NAELO|nr:uncharacterized protein C9374_008837 [Naegleria lovaniensis]KAG2377752.1 hypothetical protein C9374_008837 [Naegleria lovaniensis]